MRRLRGAGLAISGYPCYRGPHPPLTRSPFSYKEKALTQHCVGIVVSNISASEALPYCRTMGGCSPSRAPAGRSPSPAGVGWRGLPLRTDSRRGQRLPTDNRNLPAPARQRRAYFCGDSTVKSDGRWAGSPHPPQAVPLPRKDRVESEEWRVELAPGSEARLAISGIHVLRDLIHRGAVPLLRKDRVESGDKSAR